MATKITWGPLQRAANAAGEQVVARNFDLRADDGYVAGQVVIKDTTDDAAVAECERRLRLLLQDALKELG
jgi:hypothetical protein